MPYRTHEGTSFTSIATLIGWLGCLTVGALGMTIPYSRPQPPAKAPPPVQAEILNVELAQDVPAPEAAPPPPDPLQPPPLTKPDVVPSAPPMLAVAAPSPNIAFALPVEGPARIVEARHASHAAQTTQHAAPPAPPVQALTYGEGEGKQPAPEYPRQAVREGQEGVVTVRFSVGDNGRILAAEAVSPCPWPLLNDAALRAVKERWRFRPGPVRLYEVSIHFELKK